MIKMTRILMPTDLSEYADHAFSYGTELASAYDATLYLLHVVDPQWLATYCYPGHVDELLQRFTKSAATALQELREGIEGTRVKIVVRVGNPAIETVRFARDHDVDLVVLATHGRTGLTHALIGSVAERIIRMAPCPVLSIKHPENEFATP